MTSKNEQLKWNICKPISNFSKKFAYHILNKCSIYSFNVQFVKYWCKPGILLPRKSSSNVSISTMCFLKSLCITCSFFVPSFPECPRLSLVLAPSFPGWLFELRIVPPHFQDFCLFFSYWPHIKQMLNSCFFMHNL